MVQYAIRNGANIMDQTHPYNGSLTAEQFLFYEIRIAAKYYVSGLKIDEAIERIKEDIRARTERARGKYHFFRPFHSDTSLGEVLKDLRESFESRIRKE